MPQHPQPSLRLADGGNFITRWAQNVMRPGNTDKRLREIEASPPAPAPVARPAPPPPPPPNPNSNATPDNPAGIRFQDGGMFGDLDQIQQSRRQRSLAEAAQDMTASQAEADREAMDMVQRGEARWVGFQDGGGLSKEAVMEAIARQRAAAGGQSGGGSGTASQTQPQPQQPSMMRDFLRNPGSILRDRERAAGLRFQDGGVVPGSGRGDKIPAKYEPGEFVVSNDMIDDNPGLREQLAGLRAETLAARGKTVEEADAKALNGGRRPSLRAADGFDPLDRMAKDLTGQNSLPPRSPVGNMADDLTRNARAAAPEGPAARPTAPLSAADAAAYDASPEGRATKVQALRENRGYFQGNPSAAAPSAAAAAPSVPTASPARPSTLRRAVSAVGSILYGGAALGGALTAKGLRDVGAPKGTVAVPGERQAGDSANSMQIPIGGNSPAPDARPYNFWTDSEAGRNLGNAANAIAPLGGLAMAARAPGTATKAFGLADAAVTGLALGVHDERDSAAKIAASDAQNKAPSQTTPTGPSYGPIGDRTTLTNEQVSIMNPQGRVTAVRQPNGTLALSGGDVRGDVSYHDASGKPLPGGGLRGKFADFQVAPAGSTVVAGPNGSYAFATGDTGGAGGTAGMTPSQAAQYNAEVQRAQAINADERARHNTPAARMQRLADPFTAEGRAMRNLNMDIASSLDREGRPTATTAALLAQSKAATEAYLGEPGQQRVAETERYKSDNSLRGTVYTADAQLGGKRMEMQQKARQQQLVAEAWKAAKGDPKAFQDYMMQFGMTDAAKTGGDMARDNQTIAHNATNNARERLKGMAVRDDGKGGTVVDEGRLARLESTLAKMSPGWAQADEATQAKLLRKAEASVNILEGLNSQRNNGWFQALGIDGKSAQLDNLPHKEMKGAKLNEVGFVEGVGTPGTSRKDYVIETSGGHKLYLPRSSVNQGELELLKSLGVDVTGTKK